MTAPRLTPKQEMFVAEYLKDLNATQAAIRAGYSKRTAQRIGSENLSKPLIAAEIQKATEARNLRVGVDGDAVVRKLWEIGHADIRALFDAKGNLLHPQDWPDDIAFLMAGFDVVHRPGPDGKPEQVIKVKIADRRGYLDMLMKHLGLYDQDNAQKQPIINIDREDAGA